MKLTKEFLINENSYSFYDDDELSVMVSGVIFMIGDSINEYIYDVLLISKKVINREIDFNLLHGFFRMIIQNKNSGEYVFMGDNSGSQIFFIDANTNSISDGFIRLCVNRNGKIYPDYVSIKQLLNCNRILTDTTIVEGIVTTNSDSFYSLIDGVITSTNKKLRDFSYTNERINLGQLIEGIIGALDANQACAVITGGTDSRVILAYLVKNGLEPNLFITGHSSNPDIKISQRIANELKLTLNIIDPAERTFDWIEKGFIFSDGLGDSVLGYRYYLKTNSALAIGKKYEFGGVGGEFYKNSFCHAFRYRLFGKQISDKKLYQDILGEGFINKKWFGENLRQSTIAQERYLQDVVVKCNVGRLLCKYNSTGFIKLKKAIVTVTNCYANCNFIKIDPLMDRDIIASVSKNNVISMSMQKWNREEIRKSCPQLSNIPTDRGLSCSLNPLRLTFERIKILRLYSRLYFKRLNQKLFPKTNKLGVYWDVDYIEARKSEMFKKAVTKCQEIGVIDSAWESESLPNNRIGFIITIGWLFANYSNLSVTTNE